MTKTKLVDLNEIYNFVIDDLFIEKSFMVSKSYLKFSQFRFQNFSNKLRWKDNQNQRCTTWQDLKLSS
jgi:hypothetical protein